MWIRDSVIITYSYEWCVIHQSTPRLQSHMYVTDILYQPCMVDKYRAFGGIRTGNGNRNTWGKPAPVLLCPPQITCNLTRDRTRGLTSCATARPNYKFLASSNESNNSLPSSFITVNSSRGMGASLTSTCART